MFHREKDQRAARLPVNRPNDACWDGVDVGDDPYDGETEERRSWEEGWRAARKHDYDESEA